MGGTMRAREVAASREDDGPELELHDLAKSFAGHVAVQACSLSMRRGEIVALLGPSGCGKSTLLNMIAGFETPDHGTISLRGRSITNVSPHRRNIAMVFQHYAMFPHYTVAENIAYGLNARRLERAERDRRVAEMVQLLHLEGLEGRYPAQISGGQRQRVAVARALAIRPDMLLLDEAFSALDRHLREGMQLELSLLLRRLSVTTVLVTHDQREAFALADRIAIMEAGRIVQAGTPEEVYRSPNDSSVLRFLGTTNRLRANFSGRLGESTVAMRQGFAFTPPASSLPDLRPGPIFVDIRAEDIAISPTPTAIHRSGPATVTLRTFLGAQERIILSLDSEAFVIDRTSQRASGARRLAVGAEVYVDFDPADCRFACA